MARATSGVREIVLLTLGWEDLPKSVSVEGAPAAERMREPVPGILLRCDGGWLLLDTGFNTALMRDEALRRRFYGNPVHRAILPGPGEPIEEALAYAGIDMSEIYAVGLSHLHRTTPVGCGTSPGGRRCTASSASSTTGSRGIPSPSSTPSSASTSTIQHTRGSWPTATPRSRRG